MNEKCKYCNYVSKCSEYCEYDSVICRLCRSFPKIVDKPYEELVQENKLLLEENKKYKEVIDKAIDYIYIHSRMKPPYYEFREFHNVSNLSELENILKEVK